MSKERDIQYGLMRLQERSVETFVATVIEVQKDKGTCTVTDDELEYTDVQLSAVVDTNEQRFLIFPKIQSKVLVSPISEDLHRLYVEVVSEVESLSGKIGNSVFVINKDGYSINRNGENLQKVLNDFISEFGKLCDELAKVVVSVGVTPNITNITKIKNEATAAIKKRFNDILIAE